MMPLSMVKEGEPNIIKKVGGKEETRKFLENLGFVTGGTVTVISQTGGNMIVNVKDSRVAIGKVWRTRLWYRHRQCYDELYREGAEYEDIKGSCLRAGLSR